MEIKMTDPVLVTPCLENAWTLVATAISSARIYVGGIAGETPPRQFRVTYRQTGGAAPGNIEGVLVPLRDRDGATPSYRCEHGEPVDIYLMPIGGPGEAIIHEPVGETMLAPESVLFVNSASLVDPTLPAPVYPSTFYYPSAAGYNFLERRRFLLDIIATGTAVPATVTVTVEGLIAGGATWRDVSLNGYSHVNGTDGIASWISSNATAVSDLVEWFFELYERMRIKVVISGASGPVQIRGSFHGR
jgi:hypothetical protein